MQHYQCYMGTLPGLRNDPQIPCKKCDYYMVYISDLLHKSDITKASNLTISAVWENKLKTQSIRLVLWSVYKTATMDVPMLFVLGGRMEGVCLILV